MIFCAIGFLAAAVLGISGVLKVLRHYLAGKLTGARAIAWVIVTSAVGVSLMYGLGLLSLKGF